MLDFHAQLATVRPYSEITTVRSDPLQKRAFKFVIEHIQRTLASTNVIELVGLPGTKWHFWGGDGLEANLSDIKEGVPFLVGGVSHKSDLHPCYGLVVYNAKLNGTGQGIVTLFAWIGRNAHVFHAAMSDMKVLTTPSSGKKKRSLNLREPFKVSEPVYGDTPNPYLTKKGLGNVDFSFIPSVRVVGETIYVEYVTCHTDGCYFELKPSTYQMINTEAKMFSSQAHGNSKGAFACLYGDILQQREGYIFFVEGIATGLTIVQSIRVSGLDMTFSVLATGSAGNFKEVLAVLEPLLCGEDDSYKDVKLVYCGENDSKNVSSKEYKKAIKTVPSFKDRFIQTYPEDRQLSDFNDVFVKSEDGYVEVITQLLRDI
jgi:hypothetical protein